MLKKGLFITSILIFSLFFHNKINAQSDSLILNNEVFNSTIEVNNDSTILIKERIIYSVFGNFHGLKRDIPIFDSSKERFCKNNPNLVCSNSQQIVIKKISVITNGIAVEDKDYWSEIVSNEEGTFLQIKKELYPSGKSTNGESYGWEIEYKVYGGINWRKNTPVFYWNMLPFDRASQTGKSIITLILPDNVTFDRSKFEILDNNYSDEWINNRNVIILNLSNYPNKSYLTYQYFFSTNEIKRPGSISLSKIDPYINYDFYYNNDKFINYPSQIYEGIPNGLAVIKISKDFYTDFKKEIFVPEGGNIDLEVVLPPTQFMNLFTFGYYIQILIGLIIIPLFIFLLIRLYRSKGKDIDIAKTIIPLFKPPLETPPYLAGTIITERVENKEFIATIIDLAYRGYIKIREEEKGKDYTIIKLKDYDGVDGIEETVMNSLFRTSSEFKTSDTSISFFNDFKIFESSIYRTLVEKDIFNKNPQSVRQSYLFSGILGSILSILVSLGISIFLTVFIGRISVFTILAGPLIFSITLIFLSFYMPQKTSKGSKIAGEIKGFKMFLFTAERYRMQDLRPEDFVKYLSYAISFGIEKEWAEKFKDMTILKPDWYEGEFNSSIFNAIIISNLISGLNTTATPHFNPVSSSGGFGSGSFGGFSGGGGGGGSSGGW